MRPRWSPGRSPPSRQRGLAWLIAMGIGVISLVVFISAPTRVSARRLPAQEAGLLSSFLATPAYCQAPLDGHEGNLGGAAGNDLQLKMLQVVIRHGDRSPINTIKENMEPYPWCGYDDSLAVDMIQRFRFKSSSAQATDDLSPKVTEGGKCGGGQLTERGFLQQIANGRYLASKYGSQLNLTSSQEVYFRHTYYPRTFQSGGALLLGFDPSLGEDGGIVGHTYGPDNTKDPIFGVGLIGATREPGEDPRTSKNRGVCEHAVELGAEQELGFRAMPRLEEELTRVFGPKHTHLSFADSVDPVMVAVCHGHTASLCGADPPTDRCLSADTIRQLKEEGDRLYCERYAGQQGGRQGTRLAMQPFLSEVLQRFEDTASGRGPLKLALYSAHDTVVAPVVAALSAFDCRWPPYASRVVMELWSRGGDKHFVRLLYNGQVVSNRATHCGEDPALRGGNLELLTLECFERYVQSLLDPHDTIEKACSASARR